MNKLKEFLNRYGDNLGGTVEVPDQPIDKKVMDTLKNKPREFYLLGYEHIGKYYPAYEPDIVDPILREQSIHVREVVPIDWEKVWQEYDRSGPHDGPYEDIAKIQELVERALKGEL